MYEQGATQPLSTFTVGDTVNGVTFYNKFLPPANCSASSFWCGLQNGRDGMALVNNFTPTSGRVLEFISYEGSFTAKNGPAVNMTSTNIGVFQRTTTELKYSISRSGIGCQPDYFAWQVPNTLATPGTVNTNQTISCQVIFINEFHYANVPQGSAGAGVGQQQFVEVAANVNDINSYSVVLYGQDGLPFDAIVLESFQVGETDNGLTFYYYEFPTASSGLVPVNQEIPNDEPIVIVAKTDKNTTNNNETKAEPATAPPTTPTWGMALVKNDAIVVEFLSYGGDGFGTITATGGPAVNQTSINVGVVESVDTTPVGSSLQLTGLGCAANNFQWTIVEASGVDVAATIDGDTRGAPNVGQDIVCDLPVPTMAPTTIAQEEADIDDLVAQDDDFLDDKTVNYETEVENMDPVYYQQAQEEAEPTN